MRIDRLLEISQKFFETNIIQSLGQEQYFEIQLEIESIRFETLIKLHKELLKINFELEEIFTYQTYLSLLIKDSE